MRSMIRGVAVGLAVVLGAQTAQAQAGLSLGLGGGVVVPTGAMADGNATGWSGTAVVRVKPALSPVGFQVDAFYNRFGLEGGIDGHSRMIGTTANLVFTFPSAAVARPYLIGGVVLYNGKTTIDGVGSSQAETKFGLNAGAGFDLKFGGTSLFAEGRFHTILKGVTDVTTGDEKAAYMIPLTVGLRWSLR
ncbi:MAG: outer membrane beta-barrel protein [Gemmatimonadales bacterium]